MKCVINLVLPIILCGFFGCCSMDEMDFRDVEYKPADLGNYDEGLLVYDAGFSKSLAIFAHNLQFPIPILTVNPSSFLILSLISYAVANGSGYISCVPVISR